MYMWEYFVRPEYEDEFEKYYGPDGEWAKLFKKGDGYIRTELYKDVDQPLRYMTTDYWETKEDSDNFRKHFTYDFEKIDNHCELFTVNEEFLGDFTQLK